jgi:hypothetical protein
MKDESKFTILTVLSTILIVCILSYNILQEYFMTEIGGYLKRRMYFEQVISKKGLTLHKAKYWKKLEE